MGKVTLKFFVRTPRGEFELYNMNEKEAKKYGYGVHHYFKNFAIMTKNNKAIAVRKGEN